MGKALLDSPAPRSPWPPEYLQNLPPMYNLIRDLQTRNSTSKSQAGTKQQPSRQMKTLISQSPSANPFFDTLIQCLGWRLVPTLNMKIYIPKSEGQKSDIDNAQEQ